MAFVKKMKPEHHLQTCFYSLLYHCQGGKYSSIEKNARTRTHTHVHMSCSANPKSYQGELWLVTSSWDKGGKVQQRPGDSDVHKVLSGNRGSPSLNSTTCRLGIYGGLFKKYFSKSYGYQNLLKLDQSSIFVYFEASVWKGRDPAFVIEGGGE